jgi:hypothetical protein
MKRPYFEIIKSGGRKLFLNHQVSGEVMVYKLSDPTEGE